MIFSFDYYPTASIHFIRSYIINEINCTKEINDINLFMYNILFVYDNLMFCFCIEIIRQIGKLTVNLYSNLILFEQITFHESLEFIVICSLLT